MTDRSSEIIDRLLADGWQLGKLKRHPNNACRDTSWTLRGVHPVWRNVPLLVRRDSVDEVIEAFRDAAQAAEMAHANDVLQREG